jgi:diguanylate cyclase (GGDEF)-like protein
MTPADPRPKRRRRAVAALAVYSLLGTAIAVVSIATGLDDDPPLSQAFDVATIVTWGLLGAIALWRRPRNRGVRVFALAGATVAATVWMGYLEPLLEPGSRHALIEIGWRLAFLAVYFGTFPLLIELGASVPRRNVWVRRHPWLLRGQYWLAAILVLVLGVFFALPLPDRFEPFTDRVGPYLETLNQALYLYSGLFILALLIAAARVERGALARRQILVVFLGVLPWTLFQTLPADLRPAIAEALAILLPAFGFFVAILGLQLFELGVLLRRSLVAGITLAALALAGYAAWTGLASLTARALAQEAQVWELTAIVVGIGLAFSPLARAVSRGVDRLFFPEKLALAELEHALPPELAGETDLDEIASLLVSRLRKTLELDSAGLLLGDDEQQVYRTAALSVKGARPHGAAAAVVSHAALEALGLDGPPGGGARRSMTVPPDLARFRPRVWAAVRFRARLLGALWLGPSSNGWRPDAEDRTRLERIAQGASTVLESARLFRQAAFDPLTGLPRRETLLERLRRELDRCRRSYRPLVVGLADLDDFKGLNDTWGHAAGDRALIAVAHSLRQGSRSTDLIGRFGGEEFLMVLPETDLDAGVALVERLRAAVAALVLPRRLTMSVGLALVAPPDLEQELEALLERVDRALYRAKRAGKDRIEIAGTGDTATTAPGAGAATV